MTIVYVDALPYPVPRGAWIRADGNKIKEVTFRLLDNGGSITNNEAEYAALIQAVTDHIDWPEWVQFKMDSLLVCNQIKGTWVVRADNLKPWNAQAMDLLKKCNATVDWIPRGQNLAGKLLERIKP